jgi:hypothetical protein
MVLPPGAPPALELVAQRFAETSRGVVSFHLHRVFDVHAGPLSRHEDLVMEGIYSDGAIAKVRISSYTIDGKAADASTASALEQAYEHPKAEDLFNAPFDQRYLGAYRYQNAGPQKIAFTSSMRDAAHGGGTLSYDSANNVLSYTYHPNALPPHASFGEITDRRAEVAPGYWAVTQEEQQYKGRYGFFAGAGTVEVTYTNFRRFPDLQSALRGF